MRIDHAPMEGITNYQYRQAFVRHFGGIDRFYTPFLSPNQNHSFTARELAEIDPAHNEGIPVVPQLLANSAEHFLWACGELHRRGYRTVNLNLGCPSGTVVAKRKGSGLLADPEQLDRFLDAVCTGLAGLKMELSVKTRAGLRDEAEFGPLLTVFGRYPLAELIVHPRLQKDFYKTPARPQLFALAAAQYAGPLGYNGGLFAPEDLCRTAEQYPQLTALMPARGIIANPALALEYRGTGRRSKAAFEAFHAELYAACAARLCGDKALLNHMKEFWFYHLPLYTNWQAYQKPLRKAACRADYERLIHRLFQCEELRPGAAFRPE